jgi:small subunit ribosomal protein S4
LVTATSTVNGSVVNIASYTLKPGDVVEVREKFKINGSYCKSSVSAATNQFPWMDFDKTSMKGKFISMPAKSSRFQRTSKNN